MAQPHDTAESRHGQPRGYPPPALNTSNTSASAGLLVEAAPRAAEGERAAPAPSGAGLGNLRKSVHAGPLTCDDPEAVQREKERLRRLAIRDLTDRGRGVSAIPGPEHCAVSPRWGAESIGLRIIRSDSGAHVAALTDVQRCRSQHSCPACAAARGAEMTAELTACIRHWVAVEKGTVAHLTLTLAHDSAMTLSKVLGALRRGWHSVVNSRDWDDLQRYGARVAVAASEVRRDVSLKKSERDGRVAELRRTEGTDAACVHYFRALECTWGEVNGWHPHLHVLLFLPGQLDTETAIRLRQMIYARYVAGVAADGLRASPDRGAVLEIATTRRDADVVLGKYLNKIALEVARPDLKRARSRGGGPGGRRWTPFELLDGATSDRPDLVSTWHEWQLTTLGLARVTHDKGWPLLVAKAIPEEAREALEATEPARMRDGSLPPGESVRWSLRSHGSVARVRRQLLDGAERAGWERAIFILEGQSIRWWWEGTDPSMDSTRLLARSSLEAIARECAAERGPDHQAGRCVCWHLARRSMSDQDPDETNVHDL